MSDLKRSAKIMNRPISLRYLFTAVVPRLALAILSCASVYADPISAPIPVKIGQKKVDSKRLPFVCITLGTANVRAPLDKVIFEDLDSHKVYCGDFDSIFRSETHPTYPYGGDDKRRAISMAIVQIPAGHYRLKQVTYIPSGAGDRALSIFIPKDDRFNFVVFADCINYIGSVIFSADWERESMNGIRVGNRVEKKVLIQSSVEHTEKRDQKWALSLIPCLESLNSKLSPLGEGR